MDLEKIWQDYKKTKDKNLKDALISQYFSLVKYVIGKLQIKIPDIMEYDDLLGLGTIGLIEALDRFNPDFCVKFETYAIPRIKGAIIDEIRKCDVLSAPSRKKLKEIEDAYLRFKNKFGRLPDEKEAAQYLKLSIKEFHKLLNKLTPAVVLSLDQNFAVSSDELSISLKDTQEDIESPNPEEIVEKKELQKILKEAISNLNDLEKKILALYYWEDLTLKEISAVLNLSDVRICQINQQIIVKLRATIRDYLNI